MQSCTYPFFLLPSLILLGLKVNLNSQSAGSEEITNNLYVKCDINFFSGNLKLL